MDDQHSETSNCQRISRTASIASCASSRILEDPVEKALLDRLSFAVETRSDGQLKKYLEEARALGIPLKHLQEASPALSDLVEEEVFLQDYFEDQKLPSQDSTLAASTLRDQKPLYQDSLLVASTLKEQLDGVLLQKARLELDLRDRDLQITNLRNAAANVRNVAMGGATVEAQPGASSDTVGCVTTPTNDLSLQVSILADAVRHEAEQRQRFEARSEELEQQLRSLRLLMELQGGMTSFLCKSEKMSRQSSNKSMTPQRHALSRSMTSSNCEGTDSRSSSRTASPTKMEQMLPSETQLIHTRWDDDTPPLPDITEPPLPLALLQRSKVASSESCSSSDAGSSPTKRSSSDAQGSSSPTKRNAFQDNKSCSGSKIPPPPTLRKQQAKGSQSSGSLHPATAASHPVLSSDPVGVVDCNPGANLSGSQSNNGLSSPPVTVVTAPLKQPGNLLESRIASPGRVRDGVSSPRVNTASFIPPCSNVKDCATSTPRAGVGSASISRSVCASSPVRGGASTPRSGGNLASRTSTTISRLGSTGTVARTQAKRETVMAVRKDESSPNGISAVAVARLGKSRSLSCQNRRAMSNNVIGNGSSPERPNSRGQRFPAQNIFLQQAGRMSPVVNKSQGGDLRASQMKTCERLASPVRRHVVPQSSMGSLVTSKAQFQRVGNLQYGTVSGVANSRRMAGSFQPGSDRASAGKPKHLRNQFSTSMLPEPSGEYTDDAMGSCESADEGRLFGQVVWTPRSAGANDNVMLPRTPRPEDSPLLCGRPRSSSPLAQAGLSPRPSSPLPQRTQSVQVLQSLQVCRLQSTPAQERRYDRPWESPRSSVQNLACPTLEQSYHALDHLQRSDQIQGSPRRAAHLFSPLSSPSLHGGHLLAPSQQVEVLVESPFMNSAGWMSAPCPPPQLPGGSCAVEAHCSSPATPRSIRLLPMSPGVMSPPCRTPPAPRGSSTQCLKPKQNGLPATKHGVLNVVEVPVELAVEKACPTRFQRVVNEGQSSIDERQ